MNPKSLTDQYLKNLSSPRRFSLCEMGKHWKGMLGDSHKIADAAMGHDESLWSLIQRLTCIDLVSKMNAGPDRDSLASILAYQKFSLHGKLEYSVSGIDFEKAHLHSHPVRRLLGIHPGRCYYVQIDASSEGVPLLPSPNGSAHFELDGAYILEQQVELVPDESCDPRAAIASPGGMGISLDIILSGSPRSQSCAVDDTHIYVNLYSQDIDGLLSDAIILFTEGTSEPRKEAAMHALSCLAECCRAIQRSGSVAAVDTANVPKSFSGLGFTQSALFRKKLRNQWRRYSVSARD